MIIQLKMMKFMPAFFQRIAPLFLLLLGSLVLFTWGLRMQEVIGFDSRFYLFAMEMWRDGIHLFPTTYQEPYPDYPVSSTLLIYANALFFGGLNKCTAVLPSALMAAITVIFTYLIGALHHKRWGLYAVCLLFLTITFLKSARAISLDMYPTAITTACFYLIYAAQRKNLPSPKMIIFLLLILSFAFRGPIGLVMPTGVICIYYLLNRDWKTFFLMGVSASILLVFCTAVLLLLAYEAGGHEFLQRVLRMEVLGRIDNYFLPRYFYLTDGLSNYALSFPLAWLVIFGLIYEQFTHYRPSVEKKLLVKLIGWMLIILIGMSIPGDKKIRYILPMMPAVALIAAYPFIAPCKETYFRYLRFIYSSVFMFFPLILFTALIIFTTYLQHHAFEWRMIDTRNMGFFAFLLVAQGVNFFIFYCARHGVIQQQLSQSAILLMATMLFILCNYFIVEPIELAIDRTHDFVQQIETARGKTQAQLVFYKEKPDGLPIKYLINMSQADNPIFLDNEKALLAFRAPAFFVTSQDFFADLKQETATQFRIIAKNRMGHIPIVVFEQKKRK